MNFPQNFSFHPVGLSEKITTQHFSQFCELKRWERSEKRWKKKLFSKWALSLTKKNFNFQVFSNPEVSSEAIFSFDVTLIQCFRTKMRELGSFKTFTDFHWQKQLCTIITNNAKTTHIPVFMLESTNKNSCGKLGNH